MKSLLMPTMSQYSANHNPGLIIWLAGLMIGLLSVSCTNNAAELKSVLPQQNMKVEFAENVTILYSDSAQVKVRITSPKLKRYAARGQQFDEFPDGLLVEFLNNNKQPGSWLEADYALRKENDKKIYVEKNVRLYNKKNDQLLTDELIWDEQTEELYTSKAVKIAQPTIGDTSFGFGFRADQDFTRFEIERKFSAIKNIDDLKQSFDKAN